MKFYFSVFSLLVFISSYAQKTTIELNLSQGQVYRQIQESQSEIVQTIDGKNSTTTMSLSGSTKFTVTAIHDSVYEMKVLYERLALKQTTPRGSMSFDSEDSSKEGIGIILHSIINVPFDLFMSKSGKVIRVKSDTIFSTAIEQMKGLSVERKNMFKDQMKQSFGEKAFKGSYEMYSAIYPSIGVGIGDTWPIKTSLPSIISLEMDGVYMLKEASEAFFKMHGETNMISVPTDKPSDINGLPIIYNLVGKMVTDMDINTGWIDNGNVSQNIKGTMKILDCKQVPGGMNVPLVINTKITLTSN